MVSTHKVILAGALSLLMASACAAQDDPCLRRVVPASVLYHGQYITGLTSKDFRAEMQGKPAQVLSAELDSKPHRMVVVLDSSASMSDGEGEWVMAKSLASEALAASPARFQAGLIVFNDKVRVRIPVQSDTESARQALEDLPLRRDKHDPRTGRHTALWDALIIATELVDPPQFGDSIYAITDGEENESKAGMKALRDLLTARGLRLFVGWFGFEQPLHPTLEESEVFDFLGLAIESGGLVARMPPRVPPGVRLPNYSQLTTDQLMAVRAATSQIYSVVQFAYRLEVAPPAPVRNAEKWKLSIPQAKSLKPPWVFVYPARLAGCPASVPHGD